MTRPAALLDAAMTVQMWQRLPWWWHRPVRLSVAKEMGCRATWAAIEAEIVRRLLRDNGRRTYRVTWWGGRRLLAEGETARAA